MLKKMIKTSSIRYVTFNRNDLHNEKAIPTGQVREVDGQREAEFFRISGAGAERRIWLQKSDLYTADPVTNELPW
jgi:hypothetical protein